MRLHTLHLERFGHFQDLVLSLGAERPGFHLIYGPNEAGKSTTLRAIRGFFYGIPEQSVDTHTHGGDLRVTMELWLDGELRRLTRRKGRKNTLLSADGVTPVEEAELSRLLGGVSEAMFARLFGLDHEGLRAGADALLVDGGQVGESLFEAGIAGRGVRALLESLREEAGALFRARGRKPLLNDALDAYAQAQRRCQEEALSVETFREEEQLLRAAEGARDELKQQRTALGLRHAQLQRLVAVLPLSQRLDECERRLASLGTVRRLAPGAREAREQAQATLLSAEPEIEHRKRALAVLRKRLSALDIPEGLLELDAEVVAMVRDRLGSHRKAEADLPRRREAVRVAQNDARALLRRLKLPQKVVDVEAPEVVTADRARVRRLSRDFSGLQNAVQQSERQHADALADLATCEGRCKALRSDGAKLRALKQALASGRDALTRGAALHELGSEKAALTCRLERLERALAPSLSRPTQEVAETPPLSEAIEALAARELELRQQERAMDAEREACTAEQAEVRKELSALRRAGSVPTEAELLAVRETRDGQLAALEADTSNRAALDALRSAIAESDALADRLRREVDRTARLARFLAEEEALHARQESLAERAKTLRVAQAEAKQAVAALCERHGLMEAPASEVREVAQRVAEYAELRTQLAACDARLLPMQQERQHVTEQVTQLLQAETGARALPELLADLADQVESEEARAVEASALKRERERLALQVERLAKQHVADCAALDAWQAEWQDAMKGMPLRPDATVDEAQAVLDDLATLAAKLEEVRKLRRRIAAMEEDAEAFKQDVYRLRDKHLFSLGEASVEDAAMELVSAHDNARRDAVEHKRLAREVEDQEQAIASLALRCEQARRSLSQLCDAAGVQEASQLAQAEQRSAEAVRLDREREEAEAQLRSAADGLPLSEVRAEAARVRMDEVRSERDEVATQLEALDQQIEEAVRTVSSHAASLSRLRDKEGAAAAAAELSEQEATVRGLAQRYVRVRLAEKVLEREILRYRERHQGPLIARAGELFAKLTCGRYTGIEVAYDDADRAVMRCVRAVGGSAPVEGLSDGSRDPLFLALRLATLEQQGGPRLPLVLDDILIHADDGRARAALQVLGEFAEGRQVLFFTHHAHLRSLAREALREGQLSEHTLPPPLMPALQSEVQA